MSRANLAWLLGLPAALVAGLLVAAQGPKDRDYDRIRELVDVLAVVEDKYVEPLSDDQKQRLIENMINGGLARLDPYAAYLNPDNLAAFEVDTSGEFGGVGILMDTSARGPHIVVETALANSPAYDAGVQPGDIILNVGDDPTEKMTVADARKKITGKPGTAVTLTMKLAGGTAPPTPVTLVRATIPMHAVSGFRRDPADPLTWDYLADPRAKVAHIRLTGFNGRTSKELKAALAAADKAGANGLVLDLRDNPGGLLSEAVEVSELFLSAGTMTSTKGRADKDRGWTAKDDGSVWEKAADRPMAVIVNRGSASAAEIVAAALHENGRAVVVGERSYGKGSVQKVYDLPGGRAAVKLTTEKWLTPTGRSIARPAELTPDSNWGVSPDDGLEVSLTDDQRTEYYKALRRLEVIPGKPGVAPASGRPLPAPPAYTDPVLAKAIEAVKRKLTGVGEAKPMIPPPARPRGRMAA